MKKILFILESRASFGYSKNIIKKLKIYKFFKYKTVVTGTHLSKELGNSRNDIFKERIKINYKFIFSKKNEFSEGISRTISSINKILDIYKPDFILIFGDRVELLGVAISCVFKNRVVCHVQAGDKSGHIDDLTRMTLAKLSHIHFPASEKAKKRLIKLGEEKFRIFKVGAPQIDDINIKLLKSKNFIIYENKKTMLHKRDYIVLLQHSVFKDQDSYGKYFEITLKSCLHFNKKVFIIYPNYDPGYKSIIKIIQKYKKKLKNKIFIFKHLNRNDFLRMILLSYSFVGNSSSGILETPTLNIGTVNVGDRQDEREQAKNIFNTNYKVRNIIKAINKSAIYNNKKSKINNLHGDGKSSERIIKVLKNIKNYRKFLVKKTTY